ncbi:MAG: nuclear transport factor 2 family protein [Acidobacteriota bacterium]
MKKILALVSLLVLAMACAAPPTNNDVAGPKPNTNAGPDRSTAPAMTEEAAIAKEKAIWDTIKNKDYEAFGAMLADDQLEVTADGVQSKAESLAMAKEFEPTEVTFSDWKYLPIDKDAIILTYTATMKGKYKGKEFPTETARASSAWVSRGGKWLALYHQECPLKKMAAPPAASKPAKPGASPAAVTALVMGSDPVANEKAVWDAFKAKNYDGFAAVLDEQFVEVEPDGVYDKAGSVKGVSQMNPVNADLSDFKTLALDSDAALVTYTAKVGTAPAERHSSVWANRNGKWMAVFHQGGTAVSKPEPAAAPKPSASPAMSPKMKM